MKLSSFHSLPRIFIINIGVKSKLLLFFFINIYNFFDVGIFDLRGRKDESEEAGPPMDAFIEYLE